MHRTHTQEFAEQRGRCLNFFLILFGDFVSLDHHLKLLTMKFFAAVLAAAKTIVENQQLLPIDCHLLFTISEEVGVGASHVLHGDVAELVSIDNGTIAPQQYTSEYGVTIAMQDSSGPFDRQLTQSLIHLCNQNEITYSRDVFRFYRSDAAAAVEAGNDIRTALLCFALDSSHGYERTHIDSLTSLADLLVQYVMSKPLFQRDEEALGSVGDLPITNLAETAHDETR